MNSFYIFIFILHQCYSAGIMDNVVFAVNSGGEAHIDTNGKIQQINKTKKNELFIQRYKI